MIQHTVYITESYSAKKMNDCNSYNYLSGPQGNYAEVKKKKKEKTIPEDCILYDSSSITVLK